MKAELPLEDFLADPLRALQDAMGPGGPVLVTDRGRVVLAIGVGSDRVFDLPPFGEPVDEPGPDPDPGAWFR